MPGLIVGRGNAIDEASKSRLKDLLVSATEFYGIQQYFQGNFLFMLSSPLAVEGDYPYPKSSDSFV